MSGVSVSVEHVVGNQISKGLPHYFVELGDKDITSFETQNSLYRAEDYDHLLFCLEERWQDGDSAFDPLFVPSFDIIIVLFTLITVSDHYKATVLTRNEPYNVNRVSYSKRAIKILRKYLRVLQQFDTTRYGTYKLELLRCQMFLAIETVNPHFKYLQNCRSVKNSTNENVYYKPDAMPENIIRRGIVNPYRSFISCVETKNPIFGNIPVNFKLSQRGGLSNAVLWTLANSIQEDDLLFHDAYEIWIPLFDIFISILEIRQAYFLENEIVKKISKELRIQKLMESPICQFLSFVDSINFNPLFCEYVFVNCDYTLINRDAALTIQPVYKGETQPTEVYYQRVKYTKQFKAKVSMRIRRRFISLCFNILGSVPTGLHLPKPRIHKKRLLVEMSRTLSTFQNIVEFEEFFTFDYEEFMFHLIERTLYELFKQDRRTIVTERPSLISGKDDLKTFFNEILALFKAGAFTPDVRINGLPPHEIIDNAGHVKNEKLRLQKIDVCICTILRNVLQGQAKPLLVDCKKLLIKVSKRINIANEKRLEIDTAFPQLKPFIDSFI